LGSVRAQVSRIITSGLIPFLRRLTYHPHLLERLLEKSGRHDQRLVQDNSIHRAPGAPVELRPPLLRSQQLGSDFLGGTRLVGIIGEGWHRQAPFDL
jgi:hypothetical protein